MLDSVDLIDGAEGISWLAAAGESSSSRLDSAAKKRIDLSERMMIQPIVHVLGWRAPGIGEPV